MILEAFLKKQLRKAFSFRGDGAPRMRYPYPQDFGAEGLSFSFYSGKNLLRGGKYFVGKGPYLGVVIFFHGLGAGHTAYSQEIAYFAKQGYLVYAYDNTGCMLSEGQFVGGLGQGLKDQDAFFAYLKEQKDIEGLPVYAIGHSWGGYLALSALYSGFPIAKVVSFAGFRSLAAIYEENAPAIKKIHKAMLSLLKREYGERGIIDYGVDLVDCKTPVLYLQGEKDDDVPYKIHLDQFRETWKGNQNLRLYQCQERGHQPYWSKTAQRYYWEIKKGKIEPKEIDYSKLQEDDEEVMQAVIDFLKE